MTRCTIGSVTTRSQCAERRCSNALRIREALWRRGMTFRTLAEALGVSPQAVSNTVTGKNHSEVVLAALRTHGVPDSLLFDPRRVDMARKEAA